LTFGVYLIAHEILFNKHLAKLSKYVYVFFVVTMSINMFITGGRAGQVMYFVMLSILIFQYYGRGRKVRATIISLIIIPSIFLGAYNSSDIFQHRMSKAVENISMYIYDENKNTSVGQRMTYTVNSLEIIKNNLFFGVGTGDFPSEYNKIHAKNTPGVNTTVNPHNMYILVAVQLGLFGLLGMLLIFYQQIKFSLSAKIKINRDLGLVLPLLFLVIMFSDFSLVRSCIKILKTPEKILIIIQRSNGDVLFSLSLINALYEYYQQPKIDLLVNDNTLPLAKLLPHVNFIHQFSYQKKQDNRWQQERDLIKSIFRKYDLSINLTASDRSVFYALFAGKTSISAIAQNHKSSWWKKILLNQHYYFDLNKHILLNNLQSLNLLGVNHNNIQQSPNISDLVLTKVKSKLNKADIKNFIIFHPSAQYNYKIYPKHLREELLASLNKLGVPILVTGCDNQIDTEIKSTLPNLDNIFNWIGETTLEEYFALSELSSAYIGMDTLNMHITAGQNKPIFAIFGPTNLKMWSPWSNKSQKCASLDKPIQNYDDITIFQADMPCVACGKAGCDDKHGKSECLDHINPEDIFNEVKDWYQNAKL